MIAENGRRVAQLEEKLDSLVSLLKTTQQPAEENPPNLTLGRRLEPSSTVWPSTVPITPPSYSTTPVLAEKVQQISRSDMLPVVLDSSQSRLSPDDPDVLLAFFRDEMSGQFPFVIIPSSTTAAEFRRTKPFLFKAVIAVAYVHDFAGQGEMCQGLVDYLSTNLLLEGEMSLDLFQGLLVFIAWYVWNALFI